MSHKIESSSLRTPSKMKALSQLKNKDIANNLRDQWARDLIGGRRHPVSFSTKNSGRLRFQLHLLDFETLVL